MRKLGWKGLVVMTIGEVDYYFKLPSGKSERTTGFFSTLSLMVALVFRGYSIKVEK